MGRNLNNADLVQRTGKLAFYLVPGNTAYTRMEGFTKLSNSKNAVEYKRRYTDEDFERTDVSGYAASTAYALDRYVGHPVTDDIIKIHEDELIGKDAVRPIIQVDMTTAELVSGSTWKAKGKLRNYSVIPDTDGDTTDCMTYTGTFKASGEKEDVEVLSTDEFQTVSISGYVQKPVLKTLSVMSESGSAITLSPEFSSNVTSYSIAASGRIHVMAAAESASYDVDVLYKGNTSSANSGSVTCSGVAENDMIYVIVDNGGNGSTANNTYTIAVTAASAASEE